jgi:uncharacterized damage-inducible protein DinB
MVEVSRLLEYSQEVRNRYFATLAKLSWNELIRNREASWYSIRNIFIHTLQAIDFWIGFLQKEQPREDREFDEFETIDDIKSYMEYVDERVQHYLRSLTPAQLTSEYSLPDDPSFKFTGEDILIHLFEEELHHRGELIALLWQMNIEPPAMGWKNL